MRPVHLLGPLFNVRVRLADGSAATALGNTVPEIDLASLGPLHVGTVEKTLFSMITPEVHAALEHHNAKSVIVMGIEVRSAAARH